jgi:hypothetical protein
MARSTFWIWLTTGLLVAGLLALPRFLGPPLLGQAITWAVILYLLVLSMGALLRSHHELSDALLFLVPLSLFQVVPDLLLVQQHVLWFPDLGAQRFAGVPVYMAGLWVAPLLAVLWLAEIVHARSAALALAVAPLAALVVFGAAEWAARGQNLWLARNVATFQGVALYALAAEAALGLATWLAFVQVQGRALPLKVLGAAAVSVFYAGAALVLLYGFRRLGLSF